MKSSVARKVKRFQTEELPKILVVDDERGPRDLLETALSEKGFSVKVAKSGKQALQLIDAQSYDLVLSDLKMPDMSGLDLLRKIRERSPETLVILITGYATLDSAIDAIREGAYDYLTKPFQIDELYIVVQNATERIRLIKENKQLLEKLKGATQRLKEGGRVGEAPEEEEKNVELLQALQRQLYQIYTRAT